MRMRHKIEGARSRTPSPMYLDFRGSGDWRSPTGADELGTGSSVLTPRENVQEKSFSLDPRTNPSMRHVQKVPNVSFANPRAELWTEHDVERDKGLPSQDTVWSTHGDGTAHLAGYEHDFGNEYAEWMFPYSFQEGVASTFPLLPSQWTSLHEMQSYFGAPPGIFPGCPHTPSLPSHGEPADLIPSPSLGFNKNMSSTGSNGHPNSCEKPCKYLWKKRGCRDGALCSHCHLCPRKGMKIINSPCWQLNSKEQESAGNAAQPRAVTEVSVGSLGHPLSCAHPCKYNCKKSGCKDGRLCDRCHICRWDRCTDRERKNNTGTEAKVPKTTGTKEMGTQTTVGRCSQCDLGDEVLDEKMCQEIIRELREGSSKLDIA